MTQKTTFPADVPITSRLPLHDPRYRAIVIDFVEQLGVQLAAMEQARARNDFVELASLAHFLKGVAGSVGFDDFTEPSRALEGAARAGADSEVDASLAALRGLTARVVLPEEQPDPKAASA